MGLKPIGGSIEMKWLRVDNVKRLEDLDEKVTTRMREDDEKLKREKEAEWAREEEERVAKRRRRESEVIQEKKQKTAELIDLISDDDELEITQVKPANDDVTMQQLQK